MRYSRSLQFYIKEHHSVIVPQFKDPYLKCISSFFGRLVNLWRCRCCRSHSWQKMCPGTRGPHVAFALSFVSWLWCAMMKLHCFYIIVLDCFTNFNISLLKTLNYWVHLNRFVVPVLCGSSCAQGFRNKIYANQDSHIIKGTISNNEPGHQSRW